MTYSALLNKSSGFTDGQWHLKSLSSNLDISSDLCHDPRSLNLVRSTVAPRGTARLTFPISTAHSARLTHPELFSKHAKLTFSAEQDLGLQLFNVTGDSGSFPELFVIFTLADKGLEEREVNPELHNGRSDRGTPQTRSLCPSATADGVNQVGDSASSVTVRIHRIGLGFDLPETRSLSRPRRMCGACLPPAGAQTNL